MPSTAWKLWRKACSLWSGQRSADRIEHYDRDLPVGHLLLVVGVGRPERDGLLPEIGAFGAAGGASAHLLLLGADLDLDIGVGEEVLVPAGMLGSAALGGDDEVAVAGLAVEQREQELLPRLAPRRRQQQRGDRERLLAREGGGVHVPFLAAARQVEVGVID